MEYDESEPSGYRDREDMNWPDGVHIRQEDRGVMMYAVFDEVDQVSEEYGPLNDNDCLGFAEGYASAKEQYSHSPSFDELIIWLINELNISGCYLAIQGSSPEEVDQITEQCSRFGLDVDQVNPHEDGATIYVIPDQIQS